MIARSTTAIITSICVAAGAGLATWLIPAAETPPNVAQAYLEARFARDWAAAWDLLCRPARSSTGGYQAYADTSDYWFRRVPRDVEVSTDGVRVVQARGGRSFAVAVTVRSDDSYYRDWQISGDVMVAEEDGALRVCNRAVGLS